MHMFIFISLLVNPTILNMVLLDLEMSIIEIVAKKGGVLIMVVVVI